MRLNSGLTFNFAEGARASPRTSTSSQHKRHSFRPRHSAGTPDDQVNRFTPSAIPDLRATWAFSRIVAGVSSGAALHAALRLAGRPECAGTELPGPARRPPSRGDTSAVPRHGLRGVGCLQQSPKPLFQQFDGFPQGAQLPGPHYCDARAQVERCGTQYSHGVDRTIA